MMTPDDWDGGPLFDYGRLQSLMRESEVDALVGHSKRHFYYLSGFHSMEYDIEAHAINFAVITPDSLDNAAVTIPAWEQTTLYTVPSWVPDKVFAGQFYIKNAPPLPGPQVANKWAALEKILGDRDLTAGRVAFELDQLPVDFYNQLRSGFPKMDIVDASPILHRIRLLKTAEEIRRIRHATELTEKAIEDAVAGMTIGMTERELANEIAKNIVLRGARVTYMQLTNGDGAGLLRPTDRPLLEGDVIKADIGATYMGYNSDVGRTYAIGMATDEQREIYKVGAQALEAAIGAVKIGRPASDIYKAAMDTWHEAGYTHIQRHHVGHGIGLEAHEAPLFTPVNDTPIEVDMVLALEVPYYVLGLGGFAPEDILVVTSEGTELLCRAPEELPVIG